MEYVLICGSTVDMDEKSLAERDIAYIPFKYYVDGKEYVDDLGKTMSYEEFYGKIKNGAITKTSQINTEEYKEAFEKYLAEGKDIVYVSLSSGISGTYGCALAAKKELEEKYPARKVYCIDSLGASSGYGLLVTMLADLRDEGRSAEELVAKAEELRLRVNHIFFSTDLTYYVRGGRVSKTAGFIGNILKICPVLDMNTEGKLIPRQKELGRKRAIRNIFAQMKEKADGGAEYSGLCYISHADDLDDALELKRLIEEDFVNLKGKVRIFDIGTTIGSHTGTGTTALFFVGAERVL